MKDRKKAGRDAEKMDKFVSGLVKTFVGALIGVGFFVFLMWLGLPAGWSSLVIPVCVVLAVAIGNQFVAVAKEVLYSLFG